MSVSFGGYGHVARFNQVRRNVPSTTCISVTLYETLYDNDVFFSISDFVEALRGNTHVKTICVLVTALGRRVIMDPILQIIEHRQELQELVCSSSPNTRDFGDGILQAVARNHSIHTLTLDSVFFSARTLPYFVRSICNLIIKECKIVWTETAPDAIASSFQNIALIVNLTLNDMEEKYSVPILTGLGLSAVSRLKHLSLLWRGQSAEMGYALQSLLISKTASQFLSMLGENLIS
jgi:hypothetical protein